MYVCICLDILHDKCSNNEIFVCQHSQGHSLLSHISNRFDEDQVHIHLFDCMLSNEYLFYIL